MLGADKVCTEICCIFALPDQQDLSRMNVPHFINRTGSFQILQLLVSVFKFY